MDPVIFWAKELSATIARAEKAEAALAIERQTLSGVIKLKAHFEAECLEQARLLGKSAEREADLLGKLARLHSVIERASVQFFHDGTDGETAARMLTVLNEAK
jgi:hypothetical protein